MDEQREQKLGPMEPLKPAITDHPYDSGGSMDDPLGYEVCQYPDCGRRQVEHVRSWGK